LSVNQLSSHTNGAWRRSRAALKKAAARKARKAARRLLDGAPLRVTKGWAS
jgi:hypothetical protein